MPSTTADFKSSLRRLRTTPARNPRTECDCQPVAFVSEAMVAPPGARSMSIAADCFVPDRTAKTQLPLCRTFLSFGWLLDGAADRAAVRFFALIVIGISLGSIANMPAAPPKPRRSSYAGGARSRSYKSAPEASTVTLRSHQNASCFWIILLLRSDMTYCDANVRL
jgi:hypothetical protein